MNPIELDRIMEKQSEEEALLNGIATRRKDALSFAGKLRRTLEALQEDVDRINLLRLNAALAKIGQKLAPEITSKWDSATIRLVMRLVGLNPIIVIVTQEEITVVGPGVPREPLDPGIGR